MGGGGHKHGKKDKHCKKHVGKDGGKDKHCKKHVKDGRKDKKRHEYPLVCGREHRHEAMMGGGAADSDSRHCRYRRHHHHYRNEQDGADGHDHDGRHTGRRHRRHLDHIGDEVCADDSQNVHATCGPHMTKRPCPLQRPTEGAESAGDAAASCNSDSRCSSSEPESEFESDCDCDSYSDRDEE